MLPPNHTPVPFREQDLEERFVRSQGPGGQHVNKTSTCVVLRHRPTGLEVRCQSERSQSQNRVQARRLLAEKLQARRQAQLAAERSAREKLRRKHRRPSAAAQASRLDSKHRQAKRKADRRGPREAE